MKYWETFYGRISKINTDKPLRLSLRINLHLPLDLLPNLVDHGAFLFESIAEKDFLKWNWLIFECQLWNGCIYIL